ncbi:hypothetical protein Y032_0175g493 [Ancylostoma ceylanicum]|uniref:Uncharacterized protein n=1 Tax=Ancylostoma ceylanicum TaxID=53326 RepID=A0A016SUB9_9BILA|nr:hypothetical protein Y032_0175g493 [Ancylostoma ceylanicum]
MKNTLKTKEMKIWGMRGKTCEKPDIRTRKIDIGQPQASKFQSTSAIKENRRKATSCAEKPDEKCPRTVDRGRRTAVTSGPRRARAAGSARSETSYR